ncbi:uncharacterized protein LOC123904558 [Trifolium pratense]|uniref:uncharacterized protein LOC123904558 n=1 Tax=Trifolium pratense TaxID=57577 RepID=UPI001E696EE4|nr:uncharacterized protein LOC123904558 [Trifolium pratense]
MQNKLRFMDGSCPKPDQFDPTYEPWICLNNLVLFWLMNSIIPTISQSLMYTDNASQAWDDLKARSGTSFFFTKGNGLWEELELYRLVPDCMCDAQQNAKKFKEEDLVLSFLTGLNDHYAMVRPQILLMEPFPQLNAAFGLEVQHESLNDLDNMEDQSDNISASINFARKPYGKNHASSKTDKMCTYCGF